MSRSWFNIHAKSADSAEIDIFNEIGAYGISTESFLAALRPLKGKDVTFNIDCPGGSCEDGLSIFDAIQEFTGKVTMNIIGTAASMASVIILATKNRTISANGRVMIHRVTGGIRGNPDQLQAGTDLCRQFEDRIVGIYRDNLKLSETEIRDKMKTEIGTWFFGEEAVAAGFATAINGASKARAFKAEWVPLFTMLPAALFDTRSTSTSGNREPGTENRQTQHADSPEMKNLILLLAAAQGIAIKAEATDAEIEAAIKAHKPAPQKFEMNLEDPETKKLFDTAVTAGITSALPAAVKPLEDKITAQAAEITKLTGLIANGAAGGAAGGKAIEGAGKKDGEEKTLTRAEFDALSHADRNAFFRNKGKIAA